jgi:hypothetical protein
MRTVLVDDSFLKGARDAYGIPDVREPSASDVLPALLQTRDDVNAFLASSQGEDTSVLRGAWRRSLWSPSGFVARIAGGDLAGATDRTYDRIKYGSEENPIGERTNDLRASLLNERLFALIGQAEERTSYDLTDRYRTVGGSATDELFVLAEPKIWLAANHLYKNAQGKEVVSRNFDIARAVQLIEDLRPDILLVDIGFPSPVSEALRLEYRTRLEHLLRESGAVRECDFSEAGREVLPHYTNVEEFDDSLHDRMDGLGKRSSLHHHGGVVLAYELAKRQVPCTSWTDDYAHASHGIADAYVLGLLRKADVESIVGQAYTGTGSFDELRRGGSVVIAAKQTDWMTDARRDEALSLIGRDGIGVLDDVIRIAARQYGPPR